MKLARVETLAVALPLRFAVQHAAASRTTTEAVVVRAVAEGGAEGWGEGIPRPYLTGESIPAAAAAIAGWARHLAGFDGPAEAWLDRLRALGAAADRERRTAAFCALELACLDALGKSEGRSVGDLLGVAWPAALAPALPLVTADRRVLAWLLGAFGDGGWSAVKLKVGLADDHERLALTRAAVGDGVPLWIDANGAWTAAEAVAALQRFAPFHIGGVEQPVAASAHADLLRVEVEGGIPVSADESLCTRADAERLLRAGSCRIWNLRVAKHGGLLRALELAALARREGIGVQVGCLVGETSILAAAGLWLAGAVQPGGIALFEGCYAPWLLREDPARPSVLPPIGPRRPRPAPAGLGAAVDPARLRRAARPA